MPEQTANLTASNCTTQLHLQTLLTQLARCSCQPLHLAGEKPNFFSITSMVRLLGRSMGNPNALLHTP